YSLVHFLVAAHQTNQERSAALDIEAQSDLLLRRINHRDAERDQQHHERGCENAFPHANVGREIPTEQNEQAEAAKKCQCGRHSDFKTLVTADFSISIFTLSATFTITVVSF